MTHLTTIQMPTMFPFLDHPGPIAFAHRGGGLESPENTLVAFEHARALGYKYIETDAVVTRDGVLLAFHDERLDNLTDGRGAVHELPWSSVQTARVHGTQAVPRHGRREGLPDLQPDDRLHQDPPARQGSARKALLPARTRRQVGPDQGEAGPPLTRDRIACEKPATERAFLFLRA